MNGCDLNDTYFDASVDSRQEVGSVKSFSVTFEWSSNCNCLLQWRARFSVGCSFV